MLNSTTYPPTMTPTLTAELDDFARQLVPYAIETGDRVALAMVASCDFLMIEAERLEGGRNA